VSTEGTAGGYSRAVPQPLEPGDLVERYRVESVLGEGGSARVYRVRHTTLGTVHALKVLMVDHPTLRKRLLAEGKAQARLSHPNLVPVRDVLELEDGPALLMDFVPGPTLREVLGGIGMHPAAAVALFRGVAAGLAYAHSEGLVHRDLKPANVLLDETTDPPVPRVADFGLVRVLDQGEHSTRHTRVGVAMGTLGFMAPEQVRDARSSDTRTDIFSLGALLYTMLAGRAPFTGSDPLQIMNATAEGVYRPLEEVVAAPLPPGLLAAISRCLEVAPGDRFQTVEALVAELEVMAWPGSAQATMTFGETSPVAIVAPTPEPGHTTVTGLVVDPAGRGHVVTLGVALDPDGTGVQHAPGVARDAQVAAQLAVAVALGNAAGQTGVRWSIRGHTDAVHGTSVGLPLAVAVWCAHRGLQPPSDWAFTGGLDLDGQVAPVSGVPAKVRAAAAAGLTHVAVPAEGLGALETPAGLEVVPTRRFTGLVDRLFPATVAAPVRPWRRRLLVLALPLLLALTGLTTGLEPLIHDPLLRLIHGPLPADNTAILAFPPQRDARALRSQHSAVIDALVAAGARTIFFDVTMIAKTPNDEKIARAIRDARAHGVPVVLPVVIEGGEVMLPESQALREAARFGPVLAQADTALWHVRRAPVRVRTLTQGSYWHAAVQAARGHLSIEEDPRVDGDMLVIGPTRNPVWADLVYLHPTAPSPVLDYSDPAGWDRVRGRTVIIGEMGGSDDLHRTDAETVYGVEIEAALIETLLQQRAPRVVAPEGNALAALLVGLLTAAVGLTLPRRRWPIALVVPTAAACVGVALVVAGVLVALLPMAVAAGVGLWIGRTPMVTTCEGHP